MPLFLRFLPLLLALIGLFATGRADSPSANAVTIADLRCEYLVNPLGLDVAKPRLSWILTSTQRGESQTAYQVLVASTKELLDKGQGDLWDSGKVASDQTTFIEYGGSALTSREACWWKVRAWDAQGNPSAWSAPASWEMGLLQPNDWRAKWIDAPKIEEIPRPLHGTLAIVSATYQAMDGAGTKDVTAAVAGAIKNNAIDIVATNDALGGDPTPLHKKELRVTVSIGGKTAGTMIIPEGMTVQMPGDRESIPYLRKDFSLDKPIAKARVYATALGIYELDLNGQRVGDHIFAPDWTDYSKRSRYQVYDVTSLVKAGANTLGAMVGNGWYSGHIGNGGFQAWGKVPALFAQLEVTYADGSVARIVTDASWKKHGGPITNSDNMLGEDYDAQKEIFGWDEPGLDVSNWVAVDERTEAARPLDGQVDQPVRKIGERKPQSMKEASPGHWVFDLGQNMVGFVRLKVTEPAGTKLTLRHAEMLNADGTMYTTNLRGAPSIDTYVCKGGGVEIWQPRFTFHGFRYVGLTGLTEAPTKDTVAGIVVGTDIPHTGDFSTSNADINQLQSNIQWGMRGNYLSVPTDCPQRDERMGWMGDAQVFIRTATYNGDVAAFFTKWLVDVDDAQTVEGGFTDISPDPGGGQRGHAGGGTPAWGDAGVICPWTIYLMYGDRRILQQHLPAMTKWIDYCQTHSTDLIRDHGRGADYGDWLSQGENVSKEMIGTAYFAYTTSLVAKAYEVTGDTANATKYGQLFEQIKAAFNKRYVSADGHIDGNTQCAYAMALRFKLLPEALRPKAAQYLADNVKAHGDHLTTGFVGVSYLLPALTSQNQTDTAYRLFEQTSFPSWLFSVKQGATTVWERWDGWTPEKGFQDPGMNSSLGSCGEWMFDTVAGIGVDPEQPGFKHIILRPIPGGGFTHAEGTFDSIHGTIVSKWKVEGGSFSLDVTIPANTTATVYLPTTNFASVKESGNGVANGSDIKSAPSDHGTTGYEIGSGEYRFTCAMP
jgi:alpha-L-rhamnosidase